MKLHWSPRSPFVRKVMIAAHELGLADRIRTVRTVVRMGKPNDDLLPDNPLSKIPTLVLDDGTVLFDSLTIIEYLDDLAGGALFPPKPARFEALTRHALGNGLLDLLILFRNERDKPADRQTAEWLDSFAAKTRASLDRLEREAPALSARPFDVGHIAIGCALSYLDFRFADMDWRAEHPAIAAWHEEFSARPSVRGTEAVDD
ncbi:glutathione S-transferase family protein [Pararoseomonas indoligenes]|uniref:Glutathione S-transferase family protein n=1 Tax=Roseomonas indoligenes TaxID=2820811 RepID=A0A940N4C0_9PROT|nr:glutathione S-transferase family protein [Pararoseomonas indoligenes]MBP0496560.1 glutathione S-transferase family protein [Pararoseomonas indoligenes]